jgi:hypothetical protein
MIRNFEDFLKESETRRWYPDFKTQGEFIGSKDAVSVAELEKIGFYMKNFFKITNTTVGNIKRTPDSGSYSSGDTIDAYGVRGTITMGREESTYTYYWREVENSEFPDLENGWIGRLDSQIGGAGRHPRQFMSPLQFLECLSYQSSLKYITNSDMDTIRREMENLALQSPRRGRIAGKKYGL